MKMSKLTYDAVGSNTTVAGYTDRLDVMHFIFNALGILITIATLFGNTIVIIAVVTEKKLRKVGNVFILSLALSDCLVGLVVSPLAIVYGIQGSWMIGRTLCDVWVSLDVICCTASILNLCAISYARCNAILRPIKFSRYRTFSRAWAIVAFIWIYSICIALPPYFGFPGGAGNMYRNQECHVNRDQLYTLYSTIGAFYLPLLFMMYFYWKIYCASCPKKHQPTNFRERCFSTLCRESLPSTDTQINEGIKKECVKEPTKTSDNQRPPLLAQSSVDTVTSCSGQKAVHSDMRNESEVRRESIEPEMLAIYQIRQRSQRNFSNATESSCGSYFLSSSTDSSNTATTSLSESSDRNNSISTESSSRCHSISADSCRRQSMFRSHRLSSARKSSLKADIIPEFVAAHGEYVGDTVFNEPVKKPRVKRCDTDEGQESEPEDHQKRQRQKHLKSSTFRHRNSRKRRRMALSQEKRAAKTLGIVMGCFIICWLPFFIVALLRPFCSQCVFHPLLEKVVIWLGYFNSACNPVIYTFFNKDFRKAFKNMSCPRNAEIVYL